MDYELRKLQLELEERKEERKMQREAEERRERKEEEERKAQREMEQEEKKALRELAAQREAREVEERIEERRLKIENEERERRAKLDLEKKRLAAEEREKGRRYELRSQGIEVVETEVDVTTERQDSFRLSAAIKFVPPFSEDIEKFLESFEKVMEIHKFPRDKWSALIHTKLTGKAQKVFSGLSLDECNDYDILKQALLSAYARVPEFYRKRCRTLIKGKCETFSNYAFRLGTCFKTWLEQAKEDMERLKQVLLIEQFVECLPMELHRSIIEKSPKTLFAAAKFADEFSILYKPLKSEKFVGQTIKEILMGSEITRKMQILEIRTLMLARNLLDHPWDVHTVDYRTTILVNAAI